MGAELLTAHIVPLCSVETSCNPYEAPSWEHSAWPGFGPSLVSLAGQEAVRPGYEARLH